LGHPVYSKIAEKKEDGCFGGVALWLGRRVIQPSDQIIKQKKVEVLN